MIRFNRMAAPAAALVLALGVAGLSGQAVGGTATAEPAATTPSTVAGKAALTVTVVGEDGKPVSGVKVSLMPATAHHKKKAATATAATDTTTGTGAAGTTNGATAERPKALATATTDGDGKATLPNLADGSFTVVARVKHGGSGRMSVKISGQKDSSVAVTLKAPKPKSV